MHQASGNPFNGFPRNIQAILSALENGIDQLDRPNYPPCNILRPGEDEYQIQIAVAGFKRDDVEISVEKSVLTVSGKKPVDESEVEPNFIRQGIAMRDFKSTFTLGEYVNVRDANLADGILTINLLREVPDEAKPRKVDIGSGS